MKIHLPHLFMNVRPTTLELVMSNRHIPAPENVTVYVADPIVFDMLAPLVARLTSLTLDREGHEMLMTLLVHNAMTSGQVDESAVIAEIVHAYWRRCPKRYWPFPWRSLKFWMPRRLPRKILDPDAIVAHIEGP
jgi:hypothetical protein